MNSAELDLLDTSIARIEGTSVAIVSCSGEAKRPDQSPYQPSRDPNEALRLVEKYIARVVRLSDGWAAVGLGGRASTGATLPIAVCIAVIEAQ